MDIEDGEDQGLAGEEEGEAPRGVENGGTCSFQAVVCISLKVLPTSMMMIPRDSRPCPCRRYSVLVLRMRRQN